VPTHVEATSQGSQDGGSIPPASTLNNRLRLTQAVIFIDVAIIPPGHASVPERPMVG